MEEDRSAKFSPSKLDCYKNCARRYQYRYVDKISRRRKTPQTVVGVAVHASFEELYERVAGGAAPTLPETLSWYEGSLAQEWDESVQSMDARFTKENWAEVGRDCVRRYYAAHAPFDEDRTVAVEKRVGFPVDVGGHEYRIEGFVDRLSLAPDGVFEIHDYKTAKSLPTQEDVDADWQLALYELAVRRDWPDAPGVRLKWHYVRHGATLTSVRSAPARERLLAEVVDLIGRIKNDHEFKTNKGPLCDWCEFRDLCPEFAHPVALAAKSPVERRDDEGVRLVDGLAVVEEKRRALKDELKALDAEKEAADRLLAIFAKEKGFTTVSGSRAEAGVTFKEELHLPTKTGDPDRYEALEREARASAAWEKICRLDPKAIIDGVEGRKLAGEALAAAETLLERYAKREGRATVRLRRRREEADE